MKILEAVARCEVRASEVDKFAIAVTKGRIG